MRYLKSRRLLNRLFACSLLLSVSLTLISCVRTQPKTKEVKVWWGSREEIKTFLDSDKAKAERWFIQALGE